MSGIYEPEIYDYVIPKSFQGDAEWYRRKAMESGGPVLELGAGTGRITIPIAEDGLSIYALDSDEGMRNALQLKVKKLPEDARKRIVLVDGDMRSFRLNQKFGLIIAPFRVFLHNLTTEDQKACLQSVYEHLRPGGRFAFNVYHPSLQYMSNHSGALAGVWRWVGEYKLDDGSLLIRSEANHYDTVRQRVRSLHRYERYGVDGDLKRTFLNRLELAYLYPSDIRRLLDETGFGKIEIAGGFDGRPFENDTDELVIEAERV
jgi:SAM-dependent methyltransferase